MKHFLLGCLAVILLTACPSPEPLTEEYFETVKFESLVEVRPEEAMRMIDFTGDQDAKHDHFQGDISQADLLKLASIVDIKTVKLVRAYHFNNWPDSRYYAAPTTMVAISTDKDSRYFVPKAVCPPPDASTCLQGLYFN